LLYPIDQPFPRFLDLPFIVMPNSFLEEVLPFSCSVLRVLNVLVLPIQLYETATRVKIDQPLLPKLPKHLGIVQV